LIISGQEFARKTTTDKFIDLVEEFLDKSAKTGRK
jgi:hypothetical protein